MSVKVASFRNSINHLFSIVNGDYHDCVNADELRSWQDIAERVLAHVESLECKRANTYDREQHCRSLNAARDRLRQAGNRIQRLELESRQVWAHDEAKYRINRKDE